MATQSILSKIVSGAVSLWNEIVTDIDADVAKVKAALPSSSIPGFEATISDIKQGASDALGAVAAGIKATTPAFISGIEALADTELTTQTNGVAVPLVPMTNKGIADIVNTGSAALQAWALKAAANLAPAVEAEPAKSE